jgi:hypothetical protein
MGETAILEPNWAQPRPTFSEVQAMTQRIGLDPVNLPEKPFNDFLLSLRESHSNGGAHIAAFDVGPGDVFDWFASRNRLSEDGLIDSLITRPSIRTTLDQIAIPEIKPSIGLSGSDPFLLDGRLAHCLHYGGAYWNSESDGKPSKTLALEVCDAMFGMRYGEVSLCESYEAWTPWFHEIAWDLTAVVFDRRLRRLWVFVITDTD